MKRLKDPQVEVIDADDFIPPVRSKGIDDRSRRRLFGYFSCAVLVAALVCLLTDMALAKEFTWSLYLVGALVVVWATLLPLAFLPARQRTLVSLIVCGLTTIGYLFYIEYLSPIKHWVLPYAVMLGLMLLGAVLLVMFLTKRFRFNVWFVVASSVALLGIIEMVLSFYIKIYFSEPLTSPSFFMTFVKTFLIAIVFLILGCIKRD